jgi:hypothetical protein
MSTADAVLESERSEGNRWASLADRLNPNRAAFDPAFKAEWSTMGENNENDTGYSTGWKALDISRRWR